MDPGALLHPVGREPARVYWIRRAVVLVVLVIVIVLIAKLFGGGGGTRKASGKSPVAGATPTSSASAVPSDSASPGLPACEAALLTITVKPSAATYATGGAVPSFAVSVTTTGSVPCTRDVSRASLAVVVSKGSVRVWSSADCASKATDVETLTPGKPYLTTIPWGRTRSAPSCPSTTPGGVEDGTYTAVGQAKGLADVPGGTFTLS